MPEPRVLILGAGPAGLGAAYQLRKAEKATVTILEQGTQVGGNAGTFTWRDHRLDFGSHRLHNATPPAILEDIRTLLGPALLNRQRHGRIHLRGRWVHFPLKPLDLLLRLDPVFAAGVLRDLVWRRRRPASDDFAAVLEASLGPTICRDFYFPYARKMWGVEPAALSGIQARKRVSAGSFIKLFRKVLTSVPGFRPPMAGRFYYPADGFGQIATAYSDAAVALGARLHFQTRVTGLRQPAGPGAPWVVTAEQGGRPIELEADHVWSTLPIPLIARMMNDQCPASVTQAAGRIRYRAMLLVYLELEGDRFTEFDAHYFPAANIRITRLSESRNYAGRTTPPGRTAVCAELPADADDEIWKLDDAALGELVEADLATAGLSLPAPPLNVMVRRLRQAYPIYDQGYEVPFGLLDDWAGTLPRFLTFGRQGLFAHDNTHHALAMAYAAAASFGPEGIHEEQWKSHRDEFASHVVED